MPPLITEIQLDTRYHDDKDAGSLNLGDRIGIVLAQELDRFTSQAEFRSGPDQGAADQQEVGGREQAQAHGRGIDRFNPCRRSPSQARG